MNFGALEEARARIVETGDRLLFEAEIARLVETEPGFMELAIAIGDAAWGNWAMHGYDGKLACAKAALGALAELRGAGLPPGAQKAPRKPPGVRLLDWLRT